MAAACRRAGWQLAEGPVRPEQVLLEGLLIAKWNDKDARALVPAPAALRSLGKRRVYAAAGRVV